MLVVALTMSLILLIVANISAHSTRHRILATAILGPVLAILSLCSLGPVIFVVLLFQTVLLCVLVPLLSGRNRRVGRYFGGSILATVVTSAYPVILATQQYEEMMALRDKVPFVSIDERLPAMPAIAAQSLPADTRERLGELEKSIGWNDGSWRADVIKSLHEGSVQSFIESPGFGRMRTVHKPRFVASLEFQRPLIPQPGKPATIKSGWEEPPLVKVSWYAPTIDLMHKRSIIDFVNAEQFGYVKDRQHVAGFHPHGLSDVPDPVPQPGKSLQLSSIELVGLLRDKPVVYVSENIPAMSELSKAPTRPLDSFEQQGVELFKKGEDLHIQEMPSSLRVIGAIRNAQQCVKCHGGERGDLLGAFSYVLK